MNMTFPFGEGWGKRIHFAERISGSSDSTDLPAGSLKGILKTDSFWLRAIPIVTGIITLYIGILVMLKSVFGSMHAKILGGCGVLVVLPLLAVFVAVLWMHRFSGKEIRVYDDRIEYDGETYRYGEADVLQLDDCVQVVIGQRRVHIPCRNSEDAGFIVSWWGMYWEICQTPL
jgi:hypothetical protein